MENNGAQGPSAMASTEIGEYFNTRAAAA